MKRNEAVSTFTHIPPSEKKEESRAFAAFLFKGGYFTSWIFFTISFSSGFS